MNRLTIVDSRGFGAVSDEEVISLRTLKEGDLLKGRTRCWKNVLFKGPETLIGTMQRVRIHSFSHHTLIGDHIA